MEHWKNRNWKIFHKPWVIESYLLLKIQNTSLYLLKGLMINWQNVDIHGAWMCKNDKRLVVRSHTLVVHISGPLTSISYDEPSPRVSFSFSSWVNEETHQNSQELLFVSGWSEAIMHFRHVSYDISMLRWIILITQKVCEMSGCSTTSAVLVIFLTI